MKIKSMYKWKDNFSRYIIEESYAKSKNVSKGVRYFTKPYPPCNRLIRFGGGELDYSKILNTKIALYNKNLRRFYD